MQGGDGVKQQPTGTYTVVDGKVQRYSGNVSTLVPIGDGESKIPRLLHLIWVTPNGKTTTPCPGYALEYMDTWKTLLGDKWVVRMWGDADLTSDNFAPDVLKRIALANTGAQKADIMRYHIVSRDGGFYMDTDMKPGIVSLDLLMDAFPTASALCANERDFSFGWAYMTNAFFGAIPNHPWILRTCETTNVANLNTPDVHLETGPRCLGKSLTPQDDCLILPTQWFYRPKGNHYNAAEVIANHEWAASWVVPAKGI